MFIETVIMLLAKRFKNQLFSHLINIIRISDYFYFIFLIKPMTYIIGLQKFS